MHQCGLIRSVTDETPNRRPTRRNIFIYHMRGFTCTATANRRIIKG